MERPSTSAADFRSLSASEVVAARLKHGDNSLPQEQPESDLRLLFRQFQSPLVYLILAAALISLLLREYTDFVVILVVVVVDVTLGFYQEHQAQRNYFALQRLVRPTARVVRDGQRTSVDVSEIVVGDIVLLAAGEKVPADGTLLECSKLAVDESTLTGESEPVMKAAASDTADENSSRVLMGSTVLTGKAMARVTKTGRETELGQMARILNVGQEETPLQERLQSFSKTLTFIVIGLTAGIFLVGLVVGRPPLEMFRTAVVLAVAAVPEGLVMAVTVILVSGMRKILKEGALVRRLLAVETLGSVTVICTDKTGTVTEGMMRVVEVRAVDEHLCAEAAVLCNDLIGPVDVALWEFAEGLLGTQVQEFIEQNPRKYEALFTSESKHMVVEVTGTESLSRSILKGAPEVVIPACQLSASEAEEIREICQKLGSTGLRLIALAQKVDGPPQVLADFQWLGVLALSDPVRESVSSAVEVARNAGVRVVMVTGDHPSTASSVAQAIGIENANLVIQGSELANLTDDALSEAVRTTGVFARVRPQDKVRIVEALARNGEVTSMIGDGVNDAAALQRSDIGVVMGTATDLAKENADLVLLKDDFTTLIATIERGRVVFDNIRKMVAYVLSDSFAELLLLFIALLIGWPVPLTVAQILWINLVCDGPEDFVLGFEPAEPGVMNRPPRGRRESVLNNWSKSLILSVSSFTAAAGLVVYGYFYLVEEDVSHGRSLTTAMFAVGTAISIVGFRTTGTSLRQLFQLRQNPALTIALAGGVGMGLLPFLIPSFGSWIGVAQLRGWDWAILGTFAIALVAEVQIAKSVINRKATQS